MPRTQAPRENARVKGILSELNKIPGCRAIKIHTGQYGRVGTPDILCVYYGQAYFFEVKRPMESAAPIQEYEMMQWRLAGARAMVVRSSAEAIGALTSA